MLRARARSDRASPGSHSGTPADAGGPTRRASRVRRVFASGTTTEGDEQGGAEIAVTDARINEQIRAREVRLVGPDGQQIGIKATPEALDFAKSLDLDLVEVAPEASPPVCRVMDFGKYKYEQDQRRKESRKKASQVAVKEMKFRPKIDAHDYTTKMKHVERFLAEGNRVKLTIMFRGREVSHPELGRRILDRVAVDVEDLAIIEHMPKIDGRNMTMVLAPRKDGRPRPKPAAEAPGGTAAGDPVPEVASAPTEPAPQEAPAATDPVPEEVPAPTEPEAAAEEASAEA